MMVGGRSRIRLLVIDAVLWGVLCLMLVTGQINQYAVKRYSPASLRYDTPITGKAAYVARQHSIERSGEGTFWPTFWREYKASFKGGFVAVEADCIAFSGEAALVWPLEYVTGEAPSVIDGEGCAVSEQLAWKIWGSSDIIGMIVEADGAQRVIRGVFKGETEVALLSFRDEDTTQSWNAVELSGGPADAVRSDAESFASASGLGKPDAILMGGHSIFADALVAIPIVILIVFGIALIAGFVRKQFPSARTPLFFTVLIICAILLPSLLNKLPAWLIPTRWSDFSFWVSLMRQASSGIREFLSVTPQSRDVELRMLLIKQTVIAFASVCAAVSVCFRWQMRRRCGLRPASGQWSVISGQ